MKGRRRVAGLDQAILLIGVFALSVPGYAAESSLQSPRVTFTATGPAGMKVVGKGTELTFASQGAWVVFKVPLRSVSTGMGMRDRQLRDKYLEVESFPFAELRVARDALSMPALNGASEGDVPARLSLHGKTADTTVHYAIARQGERIKVAGSFRIDLRAHGIDVPNHHGMMLSPEVEVSVHFGALDRAVVADGPAD